MAADPRGGGGPVPARGAALAGTAGFAPTANLDPERPGPSIFGPIHGSAYDIAGKGIANPIGQIWSGALMLEHLGHPEAARVLERAIEATLRDSDVKTPDMGGKANAVQLGQAIEQAVKALR